ncbi:IclR family transcriptional regulator [Micromonospora echinofusca]|uniref:Helix-turn-helix domain-containing protein n=1 Tax=Micromonospora echinofusca TaxID=47858 RepID=A0ABS3VMR6_MICEH|nr:IclR family transcriptional regulator [Micromonospora echinofusca]MBO4205669.1 helix-turn-helix domain-containing protein [Micromonospora echinofusca]
MITTTALDSDASRTRSGLGRALDVINIIAERAPETLGVSTIARELGLPKAVAHRILKELVADEFLSFNEETKRYRLGSGALAVGLAALRALDVPDTARRYLVRLVRSSGETATLSVRQGWYRVYIDQVLSPHEVRMSVSLGTSHPLHSGSSSKAILAALPDAEVEDYLDNQPLEAVTPSTITSAAKLRAELARIRRQGYAVSMGERQNGAGSVAAAVRYSTGQVFGSISLCGPQDRFTPQVCAAHGALVAAAAAEISAELGFRLPAQRIAAGQQGQQQGWGGGTGE